ncbi:unnamed protein product [Adineta steineri]|uniref:polynucleotide adenylyltransferase n=1 Tax=Adineta steineri TaxID=433720 RepID=A0A818QHT0_9BILA|nr:unnamed protein product [Adineta steineri]CAF1254253.1 unnamed protein product [Adineta steineri]CAF3634955.1 unnamed protein product [Adineta steineri]CAF3658392.1 unnamed protein product [Adineta steineri]
MHVSPVYLTPEQNDKLRRVLTPTIPIYPSPPTSSFPTLHIVPKDFLRDILLKLKEHSIDILNIRLHGGAASYVLVNDSDFVYRDIDIVFQIKTPLSSQQQTKLFSSNNEPYLCDVWTIIKYIISSCLIEHIPNASTCTQYFISSVLDTYTKKNIKITSEQDSWALLSLQNLLGQNLELKFVENIKRQWQFSVDSFQIDLKPLLFEKIETVTKQIQTKSLVIDAINGVTIIKKEQNKQSNASTSPIQFGFFTPSSLPNVNDNENNIQCQTLATITTIERKKNSATSESRSRTSEVFDSTNDDNQSDSSLQFQISINEDVDDGIEADADDSTTEDDDQLFPSSVDTDKSSISAMSSLIPVGTQVYSVYKDLHQALHHLNNKLIATYEPETMRGGGLLKYCDLLSRNYKLYDVAIMMHMQRYMCSRFFIDYKTITEQIHVIAQYVATHFLPSSILSNLHITNNMNEIFQYRSYLHNQLMNSKYDTKQIDQIDLINARLCLLFFEYLAQVIQDSTVCLAHEDRELLLFNIHYLKEYYHCEYEHLFIQDSQHLQKYHVYNPQHQRHNPSLNSSRPSSPSRSHGYRGNSYRNHYNHYHHHPQRQSSNVLYHGQRNYIDPQTVTHRRN